MSPKPETEIIVANISLDELFIAMQPTEKDRLEAIEFLKNETTRLPAKSD